MVDPRFLGEIHNLVFTEFVPRNSFIIIFSHARLGRVAYGELVRF